MTQTHQGLNYWRERTAAAVMVTMLPSATCYLLVETCCCWPRCCFLLEEGLTSSTNGISMQRRAGVSEDIDALELAEPSDDEDDEASTSADEESDDEWLMAPGAELLVGGIKGGKAGAEAWILADGAAKLLDLRPPKEKRQVQQQQECSERSRVKGATLEKKRKQKDSDAVFASAEEYAGLLDENESRGSKAGLNSTRAKRIR